MATRRMALKGSGAAPQRSMASFHLNKALEETDPEIFNLVEHEKRRQRNSLVLIASENFTSKSVFDALGSVMSNKYSEGYPGARYYGGNEVFLILNQISEH